VAVLFTFEVHTPYRPFFSGRVESITLTLTDGEIGIFAKHSPFIAPNRSCILSIKDDKGKCRHAFVTDGILEVKDHKTVLMVDTAEWPEEIDSERARIAKAQAEADLESAMMKFEIEKAKSGIRRAEFRLKACEMASEKY
jgi:F-type H+-transporting ATPase subunit epsilon